MAVFLLSEGDESQPWGEGLGLDGVPSNCEARSVPLAPPQHLSRATGPVVAISYLHTFLRHGGGVGPREGPHCALSGPLPGRARRSGRAGQGAGPPGRLILISLRPRLTFHFANQLSADANNLASLK